MKFLIIALLTFSILPVFAQDSNDTSTEMISEIQDGVNTLLGDNSHSEIQDGVNTLLGDNSHSEIQDGVNTLLGDKDHESMMTLLNQTNGINKIYSYTGLVLGSIAIIITIGFGAMAFWQNKRTTAVISETKGLITETQNLTAEIKKDTDAIARIRIEVKEDISFQLNRKLVRVIRDLKRVLLMNESYLKEEDPTKKENYRKAIFRNTKWIPKILDLEIDTLKLMEIYGRAITRQYLALFADVQQVNGSIFVDEDLEFDHSAYANYLKKCLTDTTSLKIIIEPLSSKTVKPLDDSSSRDKTLQDSES